MSLTREQITEAWEQFESVYPSPASAGLLVCDGKYEYDYGIHHNYMLTLTATWEYRFTVICLLLLEAGEELP